MTTKTRKRKGGLSARVVWVTAPSGVVARRLARRALEAQLVACANLVPGLESHYRWKGRLECAREWLILFKTEEPCLEALQQLVTEHHPYDTPEFLVLTPVDGSARYLAWITDSVAAPSQAR